MLTFAVLQCYQNTLKICSTFFRKNSRFCWTEQNFVWPDFVFLKCLLLKNVWLSWVELNCLFNVTINDISVIYVTAHRCAGGLKKKYDLRLGSQRHRHFVGFFNVTVLAPTRDQPFYTGVVSNLYIILYMHACTWCIHEEFKLKE